MKKYFLLASLISISFLHTAYGANKCEQSFVTDKIFNGSDFKVVHHPLFFVKPLSFALKRKGILNIFSRKSYHLVDSYDNSKFQDITFKKIFIFEENFKDSYFENVTFRNTTFGKINFENVTFKNVLFHETVVIENNKFNNAIFQDTMIRDVHFKDQDLRGVSFLDSVLIDVNFIGNTKLEGAKVNENTQINPDENSKINLPSGYQIVKGIITKIK